MDIVTISFLIFGFILGLIGYELHSINNKVTNNNQQDIENILHVVTKNHKKLERLESRNKTLLDRTIVLPDIQSSVAKAKNNTDGLQSKLDKVRDRMKNDDDEQATVYDPEKYCAKCDRLFDTALGLAIHNGHMH